MPLSNPTPPIAALAASAIAALLVWAAVGAWLIAWKRSEDRRIAGWMGAAAMAAEAADEGEEDGLDLFSQDDEAVIDMEMLRDLISDVIREELQGPLGERITRNVRKLVRQEIARALEAQKFE